MMKVDLFISLMIPALLLAASTPARVLAVVQAYDDVVLVYPGQEGKAISFHSLERYDAGHPSGLRSFTNPRYGSLHAQLNGLIYTPTEAFWTIGFDQFTYSTELCETPNDSCIISTAMVFLQAHDALSVVHQSDLESGSLGSALEAVAPVGHASTTEAAGLVGTRGLALTIPFITDAYVQPYSSGIPSTGDESQQGSGAQVTFHLPDPPPAHPGDLPGLPDGEFVLLSAGPLGNPVAEVTLQVQDSVQTLMLTSPYASTGDRAEVSIGLTALPHQLRAIWWPENASRDAGASLWLDDELVGSLTFDLAVAAVGNQARLGLLSPTNASGGTLHLDEIEIGSTFGVARRQILFQNSFEPGSSLAPLGQESPIWLAPGAAQAAISGQGGLQVVLAGHETGGFVTAALNALDQVGVGFDLDPKAVGISAPGRILLLEVGDSSAGSIVRVSLARSGTGYALRTIVRQDDGTWVTRPDVPITDAVHGIDLEWRSAQSSRTQDGSLRLWVDGQLVTEASALSNAGHRTSLVRLGGKALFASAFGTLAYDNIVIRH